MARTKTQRVARIADGKLWTVHHGDVQEVCKSLEACSFDAALSDPPYGISFMGKGWDYQVPQAALWAEVLRVLKPGAALISFSASRTYHRMAVQIEDGGFEAADMFSWLYGQGWPKGIDLSKAIDKQLGKPRGYVEAPELAAPDEQITHDFGHTGKRYDQEANTPEGAAWQGYNTQLKPGTEPAMLAYKPRAGTHAENVLAQWTGGLDIESSRVGTSGGTRESDFVSDKGNEVYGALKRGTVREIPAGRYPSNVLLSHQEDCRADGEAWSCAPGCVVARLDAQSGKLKSSMSGRSTTEYKTDRAVLGDGLGAATIFGYGDEAGASKYYPAFQFAPGELAELQGAHERFYYQAKASGKERGSQNDHPTVKPMALMQYLAKMLLPPPRPDGKPRRILVPFCGSGSEMLGCLLAGWDEVVGIELDPHNAQVARWRVENARVRTTEVVIGGKRR